MKWIKTITAYGVHAEGEIGRVITGGILDIPGTTILDKMTYINEKDDSILRFILYEPRGCAQMSANLLLPSINPDADAAFIVMQPDGCHAMSGSNAICVTTALLETGILPVAGRETRLVLETPAGLIPVTACCEDGKVKNVNLEMVPSFAEYLDLSIEIEGIGPMAIDIAFGGCYFALVDIDQLGMDIRPEYSRKMIDLASAILRSVRQQVTVQHPEIKEFNEVEYVMFTSRDHTKGTYKNATIIHPGRVDRSPCGTGSAARLAAMQAKGVVDIHETVNMESIIGGHFETRITELTNVGQYQAVVPNLKGRAWIYAIEHFGVDPTDPYPLGYTMADTWGPQV